MDTQLYSHIKDRNSLFFWLLTILLFVAGGLLIYWQHSFDDNICKTFVNSIAWRKFFEESRQAKVFVAYARTWRNTNREIIKDFLGTSSKQLHLYLPDPGDENTVAELARRFSITPAELKNRINEAVTEFGLIASEVAKGETRLKMFFVPDLTPVTTYYLFDNVAIMAVYTHSKEKKPVPCFIAGKRGELHSFVSGEMDAIHSAARPTDDSSTA